MSFSADQRGSPSVGAQEQEIHRGLRAGSFDLGLVTTLIGDEVRPEFDSQALLVGRPFHGQPHRARESHAVTPDSGQP